MRSHLLFIVVLLYTPVFAQSQRPLPFRQPESHYSGNSVSRSMVTDRDGPQDCQPDSTHSYVYSSVFTPDSTLIGKTIWHYYNNSNARYVYDASSLDLFRIDSSVFDAMNRVVLEEVQGYNSDSSKWLVEERYVNYWHSNTTQYDSAITYTRFASGALQPDYKVINIFDGNDRKIKSQFWLNTDNIWTISQRTTYTYLPNGKIHQFQIDDWNGMAWKSSFLGLYSYDPATDSLSSYIGRYLPSNIVGVQEVYTYNPVEHITKTAFTYYYPNTQEIEDSGYTLDDLDDLGRFEVREEGGNSNGSSYR